MTRKARIYKPTKSAMQSGRAKTRFWLFEYEPDPKSTDPLMGWTSSSDTLNQIRLRFPSKEAAVEFAEEKGVPYEVEAPHEREFIKKTYAENFLFDKVDAYRLQHKQKAD